MAGGLKTGLVGAGVFAGYHAGKIAASELADFVGVFERREARAVELAARFNVCAMETLDELISASEAIIIASSAPSHYALAKAALQSGRHVLVEKPLTLNRDHADELVQVAKDRGLVLQVGHQERLVCEAAGLNKIKARPKRVEILRAGPPPIGRRAMDVSVIWDLMSHDIDLVHDLLGAEIKDASCSGVARLGKELDQAHAAFSIGETEIVLEASRITESLERHMKLVYQEGYILLDFVARTVKNTTSFSVNENFAEAVPDPLGAADEMFFKACLGQGAPLVSGDAGALAVATAEALSALAEA